MSAPSVTISAVVAPTPDCRGTYYLNNYRSTKPYYVRADGAYAVWWSTDGWWITSGYNMYDGAGGDSGWWNGGGNNLASVTFSAFGSSASGSVLATLDAGTTNVHRYILNNRAFMVADTPDQDEWYQASCGSGSHISLLNFGHEDFSRCYKFTSTGQPSYVYNNDLKVNATKTLGLGLWLYLPSPIDWTNWVNGRAVRLLTIQDLSTSTVVTALDLHNNNGVACLRAWINAEGTFSTSAPIGLGFWNKVQLNVAYGGPSKAEIWLNGSPVTVAADASPTSPQNPAQLRLGIIGVIGGSVGVTDLRIGPVLYTNLQFPTMPEPVKIRSGRGYLVPGPV